MPGVERRLEPVYDWLGAIMTELREAQGLSQRDVAQRMERDASTVAYYEQGKSRVKMHAFLAWCRALDVDPADVFSRVLQDSGEAERGACRSTPTT